MVVSPAVLAHDVSARAGDVSMGIAVFPIGWIYSGLFEKLRDGKLRQRSISVQPMREKVKSLKHVKLNEFADVKANANGKTLLWKFWFSMLFTMLFERENGVIMKAQYLFPCKDVQNGKHFTEDE